jgi:cell division protein FtsX
VSAGGVLRSTGRRLGRSKRGFLGLVAAFALVAALGAAAVSLGRATSATAARLAEGVQVVAYLAPSLAPARAEALVVTLGRLPGVRAVRPVDGRTELERLRRELGALGRDAGLLGRVEEGFLPPSLEIVLEPGADVPARAADLVARLRRVEGITAVDAMVEGVGQVAAWVALGRRLTMGLAALAAAAGLALVLGLVLGERGRRREEAAALALVGATPNAIALPAGMVGALAAAIGGVLGLQAGGRFAALVFGQGPGLPAPVALGSREALIAAVALAALGLVAGWLSMPRPRLSELR